MQRKNQEKIEEVATAQRKNEKNIEALAALQLRTFQLVSTVAQEVETSVDRNMQVLMQYAPS